MVDPYVDVRETHSGVVFLLGSRAYKLKKPVDLGFLDFTTREAREKVCHEEVALNSRLARDVYLGVADVVGPDGTTADHLIVMRRMPENARLSTLVQSGAPIEDQVRGLARTIAAFHAGASRSPVISASGSRDAIRSRWEASIAQTRPLATGVFPLADLDEIEDRVERFLAGRKPLFDRRMSDGRVVDGHGDLLADDIFCLPDGPRILDCLEFDASLRHLDELDDAAFLAMDLERLGAASLAEAFLDWYVEYSGDPAPPSLTHHYLAYRAFVRVKVSCVRHAQGEPSAGELAGAEAALTLSHLRSGAVVLTLVGGAPGTGKSSLAAALADRCGMTVLSSDRVRKELAGLDPVLSAAAPLGRGIYSAERSEETYAELLGRASRLLSLGESVVLDATWSDARTRDRARAVAHDVSAELVQLRCELPVSLAVDRIARRHGVSDADAAVATAVAASFDEWPEATTVDTRETVASCANRAVSAVRPWTDD